MSKEMDQAVATMQLAVDEELERKAKLGYKAVVADNQAGFREVSGAEAPCRAQGSRRNSRVWLLRKGTVKTPDSSVAKHSSVNASRTRAGCLRRMV